MVDQGGIVQRGTKPRGTGQGGRWSLVAMLILGVAVTVLVPLYAPYHIVLQITLYLSFGMLALSLAFIWGYGGIFSFGQAAFFGLGGYTYAIAAINMGDSTVPILLAIAIPTVFALILGYFMFYGRLSSVYVAVITLVVTLLIHKFMGHTAGMEYVIGTAQLGGYNGIPGVPPINQPGDPSKFLWPEDVFYVACAGLFGTYFLLRWVLRTRFGRIIVGIRENELRVELLGFDVRFYKMMAFTLAAAIAAVAGIIFTNWNAFIDPHVFDLGTSAQIIIWVVVGGLGTLVGPILGAIALSWLTLELGTQQDFDVNLILGAIFALFVLVVPQGLIPSLRNLIDRWRRRDDVPAKAATHG
ncbi:MAG TPA: branched-chain amino acid ABC transporter permease [Kiloniellales bacterium]|nr:branched-chain amino acid ABC transporter permease [Kiloniellales bacterium]